MACDCPSFDEMRVVDTDAGASAAALSGAELALANFAAWTGAEGVCVPEIRLRDDLPEPLGLSGDWEVGGRYRGRHRPIDVDVDPDDTTWRSTFHELCHAIDTTGDHSRPNTEIFAGRSDLLPNAGPEEDFALACQSGPVDAVLDELEAEQCSYPQWWDDGERYVADVVFPDAPRWELGEAVPVATRDLELAVAKDAIGYDDGVATLQVRLSESREAVDLWVEQHDLDLTVVRREDRVARDVEKATGRFVPADEGLWAVVARENANGWSEPDLFDVTQNVDPDGVVRRGDAGRTSILTARSRIVRRPRRRRQPLLREVFPRVAVVDGRVRAYRPRPLELLRP